MKSFLQSIAAFSDEELNAILNAGLKRAAESKELLFKSESLFSRLWFIEQGMIRAYRIIDGEDFTFFFFTQSEFATDYQSYLTQEDSPLFFEALTDTRFTEFTKDAIEELYIKYPLFERVGRLMAEKAYLSATDRLKQFQTEALEIRYQKLLAKDSKLFQEIPQYHIASYLGVRPQSLSRLRAKLMGKIY